MGIETLIDWCDSTINPQMGCNGCELWTAKSRHCYAGTLTEKYAGINGWPAAFDKPQIFPGRIDKSIKWPNLTGHDRPNKPWLNGRPRIVFLDDMGDTFTEGLPIDWLMPEVEKMKASPHIYLFLTKRPKRMLEFGKLLGDKWPDNFWPGISITDQKTANSRMPAFVKINSDYLWLSVEPMLSMISIKKWLGKITWVVVGGESGPDFRPMVPIWALSMLYDCEEFDIPFFMKQAASLRPGVYDSLPQAVKVRQFPVVI